MGSVHPQFALCYHLHYWEIPLRRVHNIFYDAFRRVSGLARTVRGPSMSATPGKVRVLGIREIENEKVFVLDFLQAHSPERVGRPFFAEFNEHATWFDQLLPALGRSEFFFNQELQTGFGGKSRQFRSFVRTMPVDDRVSLS